MTHDIIEEITYDYLKEERDVNDATIYDVIDGIVENQVSRLNDEDQHACLHYSHISNGITYNLRDTIKYLIPILRLTLESEREIVWR